MAVAVVERFEQESIYRLSAGPKKGGHCSEMDVSGRSTVFHIFLCRNTNTTCT